MHFNALIKLISLTLDAIMRVALRVAENRKLPSCRHRWHWVLSYRRSLLPPVFAKFNDIEKCYRPRVESANACPEWSILVTGIYSNSNSIPNSNPNIGSKSHAQLSMGLKNLCLFRTKRQFIALNDIFIWYWTNCDINSQICGYFRWQISHLTSLQLHNLTMNNKHDTGIRICANELLFTIAIYIIHAIVNAYYSLRQAPFYNKYCLTLLTVGRVHIKFWCSLIFIITHWGRVTHM